jgi:acetyltransferase-like isoleucine patch superfamily enzyme
LIVDNQPSQKAEQPGGLMRLAKTLFRLSRMPRYLWWGFYHRVQGPLAFRRIGSGVKFNGKVRIEFPFSNIVVSPGAMVGIGCYFSATRSGSITIGERSSINDFCYITSNSSIDIGSDVMLGEMVSIRDFDHGFENTEIPISEQGLTGGPIAIGDGTWIGRGVIVTSGVTIGKGCVIGANSVVTKSLPDWSVAVGVPCRVLRSRKADKGS